jgi:hypothetical protein
MKATHIVSGREIVRRKPVLPAGYRTPPKSVKLEKLRKKRNPRLADAVEAAVVTLKTQKVRTLKDLEESESRSISRMRAGGMNRMRNHR